MREKTGKISFGVMDVFIIVLILACIAGVVGRYMLTDKNGILAKTPERSAAAVHVLVTSIENTSADYFSDGVEFSVGGIGETGKLMDTTIRPAENYAEDEEGELYIAYDDEENGKKDVRCTLIVSGWYQDGVYLLGGREPMLPGATVELSAEDIRVTALILDVTSVENGLIS